MLVVSADVYRPAAIKQLETLAEQVGVDFFPSDVGQKPVDIVNAALKEAKLEILRRAAGGYRWSSASLTKR